MSYVKGFIGNQKHVKRKILTLKPQGKSIIIEIYIGLGLHTFDLL